MALLLLVGLLPEGGWDKMKRITFTKPNGDWGIEGVDLAQLPPKLYSAVMKLKWYEDGGLSPDQVIDLVRDNRDKEEWQ